MSIPTQGLPSTKKEALEGGVGFFMPTTPCRNGHIAPRAAYRNRSRCTECSKVMARRESRKYYSANKEKCRVAGRAYDAEARASGATWAQRNPEAHKAMNRAWKANNKGLVRLHAMNRKAAKLRATPQWLTAAHHQEMAAIYREAAQMSAAIRYEVDHIVPLQGKTVSGLHVPWNLRILTAEQNNRRPRVWDEKREAA